MDDSPAVHEPDGVGHLSEDLAALVLGHSLTAAPVRGYDVTKVKVMELHNDVHRRESFEHFEQVNLGSGRRWGNRIEYKSPGLGERVKIIGIGINSKW